MRCPHCSNDIADDARNCAICGRPLPARNPDAATRRSSPRFLGFAIATAATIALGALLLAHFYPRTDHTQARVESMHALLESGHYDEALTAARAIAREDPANEAALCGLARAYEGLAHFEEAERAYQNAIAITPSSHTPYAELIAYYARQNRPQDAEGVYAKWLDNNPGVPNFAAWETIKSLRAAALDTRYTSFGGRP